MLTRDDEHRYFWNGQQVPGITKAMEPIHSYDGVPEWILERKADLGTKVHLACELHDNGTLDETSLDAQLVPYLDAWMAFREERGGPIKQNETILYNEEFGYAGQLDRRMQVETPDDLVEIKTTSRLFNAVGVQLAAHQRLVSANDPKFVPGRRFAVQLKADGKYTVREYRDRNDWPTFVACLSVAKFNLRHGGK